MNNYRITAMGFRVITLPERVLDLSRRLAVDLSDNDMLPGQPARWDNDAMLMTRSARLHLT